MLLKWIGRGQPDRCRRSGKCFVPHDAWLGV